MSELAHYGIQRKSGRYPWGSGDNPHQNSDSFLSYVNDLKKKGMSEVDIAKGLGITTSQLRAKKSIYKDEKRKADVAMALRLKNKGYSNVAIGERMGLNESSVRSLLNPALQQRSEITKVTADMLKAQVSEKGYIDVGSGVENHIGISRTKLKTSIAMLQEEGYKIHYVPVEQLGTGKKTSIMVLTKDDVPYSEVYNNKDKIKLINNYTEDGGRSYLGLETPKAIPSSRVAVKYKEDGGDQKDGVIELRRGVDDISLGNSKYAQVRISVDGTHYLKGMAIYSDDLPKGIDIRFNTNKSATSNKLDAMKNMKDDPDNPFGSTVRQKHFIDSSGKKQLSALNIVSEEGDWNKWSKTIASQVLSKQAPALAKKQLDLLLQTKKEEYNDIMKLTNPAVKKRLLAAFADGLDSAAVDLQAAGMPRQSWNVILPFPKMKETEIYAPKYRDGEEVVLIRYPHGGKFEIPQLKVNNKNVEANALIKNAKDAVGINHKTAARLSGADFDGDTVLVIPNSKGGIKTLSALKGLANFEPQQSYPAYTGMPKMSPRTKQMKMGDISNLITDMTIKGAPTKEIARAVRHSMVVIDAEKHNLNYKQSAIDNGIAQLKEKYQGSARSGAATLISKASSEQRVGIRKEKIDPKTGKKIYEYTNETYKTKTGKEVLKTTSSKKLAEEDDAFKLSSGTQIENVYATHSNKLKMLANDTRKAYMSVKDTPYSPSAKKAYQKEVVSLMDKLNIALRNSPLERQAQLLANSIVDSKRKNNPALEAADIKKIKGQALAEARVRVGAKKQRIDITDSEWEAIQAGAISTNSLTKILNNTNLDKVKELATPRSSVGMSPSKVSRAKAMLSSGRTQAEVADALGVSVTTLAKAIS